MVSRFFFKEDSFYILFKSAADLLVESTKEFKEMLSDLDKAEGRARKIKDLEHRGDEVAHKTIELLHTTFITPFDREDIYELISKMDDVIDQI